MGGADAHRGAGPPGLAAAARHHPVHADDAVPGAARKGCRWRRSSRCAARIACLTAHGGLTGCPQVSLPGATVDGLPVGLSIVGGRGSDAALVAVAGAMEASR